MSVLQIAHLSDPHFGTVYPETMDALIASLSQLKPGLILLTGDITQRARRSQFLAAKRFTHRLSSTPLIAVPGNHDIPLFNLFGRFLNPYRGFKKLFKDQLEKDFAHGDVVVCGMNSTSRWRHVQGDFNIARIARRLQGKRYHAKIHIAAFHHPLDCAKEVDEKNLLKGRDQTMVLFEKSEVDLVVGGHIHDPFVTLSDRRYPEVKRKMVLSVAGTCLSWRTRQGAPNSFNWIQASTDDTPRLELTRYDLVNGQFSPLMKCSFVRATTGWQTAGSC